MMAVKDNMIDFKFYSKRQPLQHHTIECIGWLHWYIDKVDCSALESYLIPRVSKLMKKKV